MICVVICCPIKSNKIRTITSCCIQCYNVWVQFIQSSLRHHSNVYDITSVLLVDQPFLRSMGFSCHRLLEQCCIIITLHWIDLSDCCCFCPETLFVCTINLRWERLSCIDQRQRVREGTVCTYSMHMTRINILSAVE